MNLFEYQDYRKYLKDRLKQGGRGLSKQIAELMRIHPSLISQIIAGTRDLTSDQVFQLSQHWQLTKLELEYFTNLVEIEKAITQQLKTHLVEKLQELKKQSLDLSKRVPHQKVLSEEQKSIYYSSWIFAAIKAYTSIDNGKTTEEIMEKFQIDRPKAISILQFLTQTGLCTQESNKYKLGTQSTHLNKNSPHVQKHHMNWRLKAMEKAERLSDEELMFSAPLSISEKDFAKIREQLVKMIKEASETVKDSNPEFIACLNFDLIKLN